MPPQPTQPTAPDRRSRRRHSPVRPCCCLRQTRRPSRCRRLDRPLPPATASCCRQQLAIAVGSRKMLRRCGSLLRQQISIVSGNIQRPVSYYMDGNQRVDLTIRYFPAPQREKREAPTYANVTGDDAYINAAFRSSRENEVYLFMKNDYVLLNYAPGTTGDRVVNGPLLICDGYPSLTGTAFAEHGIDCAFGSCDENEAFIFSGNLCARINFAPGSTDDWIIKGPTTIARMFSFFKGTIFESGIDAAFESTASYEAYLFKGDQYALINYSSDNAHLIHIKGISEGYHSLRGTCFETGIDAAFASHRDNEAYIFKGDLYALIDFAPATTDDKIINGPKKILPNWPSLSAILPRENLGIDVHHHSTSPDAHRDHDEL